VGYKHASTRNTGCSPGWRQNSNNLGGNYFVLPPSQGWICWDKGQRDFSLSDIELAWTNQDKASRIFTYSRSAATHSDKKVHATQKPVELMLFCLKFAGKVQTVFDPYAGSSSTGVACIQLGLKCTLIEREERMCEESAKRLTTVLRAAKSCLLSVAATKKVMGLGV
jgi:DNA modification methylase